MQTVDLATKIGFRTRNLSLEEYKGLSESERNYFHALAREENENWIENQLQVRDAAWLMVVDGQVIDHGESLEDYPEEAEIRKVCEETGKFPFVFVSDLMLAVEESTTTWHRTAYSNDYYPTLGLQLLNLDRTNDIELIADFDTGASSTFTGLDRLVSGGIVETSLFDVPHIATHLNQRYSYVLKHVLVQVSMLEGPNNETRETVICVRDWHNSPFVRINPSREMLVGRHLPAKMTLRLILDFVARRTEIDRRQISEDEEG